MQILFDGYCPESLLVGKQVEMRLNEDDFWESEATGLQVSVFPPFAAVLPWRGKGMLRESSPQASQTVSGLMLVEALWEEGKEFLPDERRSLSDDWDLEAYISSIYATKSEFDAARVDPKDPKFQPQADHLSAIPVVEYQRLLGMYDEIRRDGLEAGMQEHRLFSEFHQRLYDLNLVFSFNWMNWRPGWRKVNDEHHDFQTATLLEIAMCLTVVFRSDHFNEGAIEHYYRNGTIDKLMNALRHQSRTHK